MGTNFVALSAYYLASPLNLLTLIIPAEFLREALTLFLMIRIGCAGLFTAIFLKSTFKRNDITLPLFSVLYALCAFTMGYYWNIIWFDTFALLPLVVLGTVALVREGKFRLYIISLALAVMTNYYMGFLSVFYGVCLLRRLYLHKNPVEDLFQTFGPDCWQLRSEPDADSVYYAARLPQPAADLQRGKRVPLHLAV